MNQKALMSALTLKPQLVRQYEDAHKRVFGKPAYVPPKMYNKFIVFERDLWDLGIDPAYYADTVVAALQRWAVGHGYKRIPLTTFLGGYGFKVYSRIAETQTVEIQPDSQYEIQWAEELVMRANAYANSVGTEELGATVERLRPILSQVWLDAYDNGYRQ